MSDRVVSMISLGCVKNTVDTEGVLGAFVEGNWLVAERPRDADVLLINTCGFIADARDESFEVIARALELKQAGVVAAVVVMGCLVQLLRDELARRFPDVDAWVGLSGPKGVVEACEKALDGAARGVVWTPDPAARGLDDGPRLRITPRHVAYLRIAEGCDNRCRYCRIPDIRGPLRSKPIERVVAEAKDLLADGARELILIAQDTARYGADLYGEGRLPALLRELRTLDGLEWLRLLYVHPAHVSEELIAVLAEGRPLLPYVDLPVQHASDDLLERMGRGIDQDGLREVIGRLRTAVPDVALRTTVIVGFPGEDEAAFRTLLGFVRDMRFDRLGAFAYSREEGTPAAAWDDDVPAEIKQERLAAVMELQQEIADEQSRALIGREIDVVVDGRDFGGEWVGRTVRDAPDVDGAIRFDNVDLRPGTFARAEVSEAFGYDLVGRIIG